MHRFFLTFFASLTVSALLAFSVPALAAPASPVQKAYKIDPNHTRVIYFISHLGFSRFMGHFNKATGTINFNVDDVQNSSVDVTIDATSLSMDQSVLDNTLQGPQYFDTQRFPTITFKSTRVQRTGPATGDVTGDLTLHGMTRPVTLQVKFNRQGMNRYARANSLGFSATGKINRSDFGIRTLLPDVGDEVTLQIEAEANDASAQSVQPAPVVTGPVASGPPMPNGTRPLAIPATATAVAVPVVVPVPVATPAGAPQTGTTSNSILNLNR
ncbi:MAG: polyisoprenoid-binding protein [Alphaproteobacteria bacterium]|nr:polyisoprenoid-binding protein [Alphaproteobacteria bacterium]